MKEELKEKIKEIINTKKFHIIMVVGIIIFILLIVGVITIKYSVEGDTNLPFELSKISVISSVKGEDNVEDTENKWNIKVNQNNDVYLYIKKNENNKETEVIKNITINNFNVIKAPQKGELKIYRPDNTNDNTVFSNKQEFDTDEIKYNGDLNASIKDMKIANQGGLVVFRYAIDNIGNYISNEDEQIEHSNLLKKIEVSNEELKFKVSFDIYIELESNKTYKSNIELELPVKNVVDNGVQSEEVDNLKKIVFKRI